MYHILIVSNEVSTRTLLKLWFETERYSTISTDNGQENVSLWPLKTMLRDELQRERCDVVQNSLD